MKVKGGHDNLTVNPADGVLDEDAEREAFQDAVMEWRRSMAKGPLQIVRDGQSNGLKMDSELGPFDPMADEKILDFCVQEIERRNDGMWTNPFQSKSSEKSTDLVGLSLADGILDEESEHAVSILRRKKDRI